MPDSDDSELEGVLTNVLRAIMRPPGHSGKAKRGHLCFDASFETGNLGRIDFVAEHEYDLLIRPDTSNPRFRFWFNFNVDNAQAGQLAIFNIVNLHKTKNLFAMGLTPLVRSTSRPGWRRVPLEQVYYHRSVEHRGGHLILSFCFCFDVETDVYQFALSYPYSYSRFQAFLAHLEDRNLACTRRTCLAQSVMKRRCDLLTITSSQNMTPNVLEVSNHISLKDFSSDLPYSKPGEGQPLLQDAADHSAWSLRLQKSEEESVGDASDRLAVDSTRFSSYSTPRVHDKDTKRVVVIIARAHPAESPTSYIIQGIIEMLSSNNDVANRLREHVVFKIVPMLNPDGVFLGNYRSSLMGVDLNRRWGVASPYAHPTLHATKSMILGLNKAKWCELDLVLDLHASNSKLGTFIYGNSYDDVYRHERHIVFPKMVSHACEDYSAENTIYNRDPQKAQTARRWFCNKLKDTVNVYSIHTSLLGYRETRDGPMIHYNEDAYYRVGRNLVRAILDYYQFLGIIPSTLPDALPLHDLPRLRPGSPVDESLAKSGYARGRLDFLNRLRGRKALGEMDPNIGGASASSDGTSKGSDSSESSDTSDDERLSEGSGFLVKIVQHVAPPSSGERTDSPYEGDNEGVAEAISSSRIKSSSSRRLPATTHVHLYPGQEVGDEAVSLPDLPGLKTSLRSLKATHGEGGLAQKAPSSRKPRKTTKSLTWKQPIAGEHQPLAFRYLDFRTMTRPKLKKRRLRRKAKSRSPNRSRSRSRSRPRRKRRTKAKKNKRLTSKVPDEPCSSVHLEKLVSEKTEALKLGTESTSEDTELPESSRDTVVPERASASNVKSLNLNILTKGGLKNTEMNSDSWQNSTLRKSSISKNAKK